MAQPTVEGRASTSHDIAKSRGRWIRETHARHRDHSPTLGRFIERDPIGFEAGGNNWYRFVANGPTGKTDPRGLDHGLLDVPNWGLGVDKMHFSSHSADIYFKCKTELEVLRLEDEIYSSLKKFDHFNWLNGATVFPEGDRARFTVNGGPAEMLHAFNTIDVALAFDDANHTVTAVTLGDHPLVGVRKFSVSLLCAGHQGYMLRVQTEAYERARLAVPGSMPAANILGQTFVGEQFAKDMWARYLKNIAEWAQTRGGTFDGGIRYQRYALDRTDDRNPFRVDLPLSLRSNYPTDR